MKNGITIEGTPESGSINVFPVIDTFQPIIAFNSDYRIEAISHAIDMQFDDYKFPLELAVKMMEATTSIYSAKVVKSGNRNKWILILREYDLITPLEKMDEKLQKEMLPPEPNQDFVNFKNKLLGE